MSGVYLCCELTRTDEMACRCTVAQATVGKTWKGALLPDNRSKWQKNTVATTGLYDSLQWNA